MKTTLIALVGLLAAAVSAIPTGDYPYTPCEGLYSIALCCGTDILGNANVECYQPPTVPTSPSNFQSICAANGDRALCCVIPILGQQELCEPPIGVVW
ncbi:Cerato-ulmin hydrophobin family [Xylariaceae sp. AK1471]|nr:Cerato-ulmin hydrophobin family [Xylariaceae sp. AK1471]